MIYTKPIEIGISRRNRIIIEFSEESQLFFDIPDTLYIPENYKASPSVANHSYRKTDI
jgi:hypothetical protein